MKILLGIISAFLLVLQPADDVQLQYLLKVGDEYTWVQTKKQSVKQTIMGMDQEMHSNMHGEYHLKVVDDANNNFKIEARFVKLKTTAKSMILQVNMDSEGPDSIADNRIIKTVINKPFYVFMNNRGEIVKLDNTENLVSDLNKIKPNGKEQELTIHVLRQFMSASALKANFKEVFIVYPEAKVKSGDKWKTSLEPGMNFPMTLNNTWSVAEMLPAAVNLTGDGTISSTDKTSTVEFAGMKARADIGGKQTLKANINLKTGMPTKQDAVADLKGTMLILAGGMIPTDMEVPVQVNYKTVHVIKRKQNPPPAK